MRILVAGGTGFLGRALLARLAASTAPVPAELDVLVLSRRGRPSDDSGSSRHRIRHVAGSWSEASRDSTVLDFAPQVVVNLVGDSHPRSSIGREAVEIRNHVLPFFELVEALEPRGLERVVFSSSAGSIYRSGRDAVAKDEADTAYHSTKRSIEHYLSSRSVATGLPAVSVRISNPVGDLDRPGFGIVGHFARAVANGDDVEFIGDYTTPKDYVALDDVAAALAAAATRWAGAGHAIVDVGSGWAIDAPGMYKLIRSVAEGGARTGPGTERSPLDHGFVPSALDLRPMDRIVGWRPRHDVVSAIEALVGRHIGDST